ncbi:MAG: hypothetical protein HQK91_04540 [Nitrospirae bacterium]|nr:hypothetical protein [Nitrospirota bacterium]
MNKKLSKRILIIQLTLIIVFFLLYYFFPEKIFYWISLTLLLIVFLTKHDLSIISKISDKEQTYIDNTNNYHKNELPLIPIVFHGGMVFNTYDAINIDRLIDESLEND